ncbi:MAG: 4-hydroxybenzoate octaprenyltransferase [Alphaproteobacteria bacterium]
MRGAGCTINDILDRDIDARVDRTKSRPLPSGKITVWQAVAFLAFQALPAVMILAELPRLTIWLGMASLPLIAIYPLMKRFTWWPQLVLGMIFNWGVLMGWAAATGSLSPAAYALYLGAVMWTMVYDTIYAHQDKEDDRLAGVKSTALLFGKWSRPILFGFAALSLGLLAAAGAIAGLGWGFYAGLGGAAIFLLRHLRAWKIDDPADCLKRFRSSRDFGLLVLAAIMLGKFF